MPRMYLRIVLALSLLLVTVLAGCSADDDSGPPCTEGAAECACFPNETCNVGLNCIDGTCIEPDAPSDGSVAALHHVDPCPPGQDTCIVELELDQSHDLVVRAADASGDPVANALIEFDTDVINEHSMTLASSEAFTNDVGLATTSIHTGQTTGAAEVTAIPPGDRANSIVWAVAASTSSSGSYRVSFEYSGSANLKDIDVKLFPDDTTCASLASDPSQVAVVNRQGQVDSSGSFPTVIFPDRPMNSSYTVLTEAASAQSPNEIAATGCLEGNPAVTAQAPSVDLTVTLVD